MEQNLLESAIRDSKNVYSDERVMDVGDYVFPGVSFKLRRPIFNRGSNLLKGVSVDDKTKRIGFLAAGGFLNYVKDKRPVFADWKSQQFYDISDIIEQNNDNFIIYSYRSIDPLVLFGDFHIDSNGAFPEYNCIFNGSKQSAAVCQTWFGYNWPDPEKGIDPFDLDPIPKKLMDESLSYKIGAYSHAMGSVSIDFKGYRDVNIKYEVSIDAVGGIGFGIEKNISIPEIPLGEECATVFGFSRSVLGVNIELSLQSCVAIKVNDLKLFLPSSIEYYKRAKYHMKKSGTISSIDGIVSEPFDFNTQPSKISSLNSSNVFDFIENIQFDINPIIDLFARVEFKVGSYIECRVDIGTKLSMNWTFHANSTHCICPYLMGKMSSSVFGYINGNGLMINKWEILPPFSYQIPLYVSGDAPDFCLFSPKNSIEGMINLTNVPSLPATVIMPYEAFNNGSGNGLYSIRMDTYSDSLSKFPYNSLQLQSLQIENRYQKSNLSRIMILKDTPISTIIKFNSVKSNLFFDDIFDFEGFIQPFQQTESILCGSVDKSTNNSNICLRTLIFKSTHVQPFKEFVGHEGLQYVSFKPIKTSNDKYGMIIHGNDESYSSSLDTITGIIALDNSALHQGDYQKGEYSKTESISISFDSLYFEAGLSSSSYEAILWFYRCDKQFSDCISAGRLFLPKTYRKQNNTASSMNLENWSIPFDLSSNDYTLKITLSINTLLWETRKEWKFSHSELISSIHDINEKSIEKGSYIIRIRCNDYSPAVLFKVSHLPNGFRGIVSRIFQTSSVWNNHPLMITINHIEKEQYGILRYFLPYSQMNIPLFAIVHVDPDIVPLCDHQRLDKYNVLINIGQNINWFSTNDQTRYFNDSKSTLNIPYRRSSNEARIYNVSLNTLFISHSNNNAFCSNHTILYRYPIPSGCIETSIFSEKLSNGWIPLFMGDNFLNYSISQEISIEKTWQLIKLLIREEPQSDVNIKLISTDFSFPANSSSLFISSDISRMIIKASTPSISIDCTRCHSLKAYDEEDVSYDLEKKGDKFIFKLFDGRSYIIKAICNDESNAFCETSHNFNHSFSMVSYQNPSGVDEIASNCSGTILQSGVLSQVIYDRDNVKFEKSWNGKLKIHNFDKIPSPLNIIVDPNENFTTLSCVYQEIIIPFSVSSYYENPDQFFNSIGSTKPKLGFENTDINYLRNGQVKIRSSLFSQNISKEYSKYVDVPDKYISGLEIKCGPGSKMSNNKCVLITNKNNTAYFVLLGVSIVSLVSFLLIMNYKHKPNQDIDNNPLI